MLTVEQVHLIVPVEADSVAWANTLKPMLLPISSLIVPETKYNPSDEEFNQDLNKFETVLIGGGGRVQRRLGDFPYAFGKGPPGGIRLPGNTCQLKVGSYCEEW